MVDVVPILGKKSVPDISVQGINTTPRDLVSPVAITMVSGLSTLFAPLMDETEDGCCCF